MLNCVKDPWRPGCSWGRATKSCSSLADSFKTDQDVLHTAIRQTLGIRKIQVSKRVLERTVWTPLCSVSTLTSPILFHLKPHLSITLLRQTLAESQFDGGHLDRPQWLRNSSTIPMDFSPPSYACLEGRGAWIVAECSGVDDGLRAGTIPCV